jgi:copper transport protein
LGIALLALLGALLGGTTPAYAHAILVRSEPPDGASLAVAPEQLRLWFSEPVAIDFTALELVDGDGQRVLVQARADAASLAAAVRSGEFAGATLVVVELPHLAPDVYRLSWRTLSSNDLHNTSGTLVFGVGRTAAGMSAAAPIAAPSLLEVALRWINFGAVAALIGALAIAWLASKARDVQAGARDGSAAAAAVLHKLRRLALWSGLLALVAGCTLLGAQALAPGGTVDRGLASLFWQIVGGTSYGFAWVLRQGTLTALIVGLMVPTKRHFSTLHYVVFAPLLLGLLIAQALQSHATAFASLALVRVAADAAHGAAAGIWAGGVLALAVAVAPLLRRGADEAALAWNLLRRFGALAAAALAVLLVTGLFMTGQQVASLDALLTTFYGQALLLKVALALGVAWLGLHNAAMLHQRVAALLHRSASYTRIEEGDPSAAPPLPQPGQRPAAGRLTRTIRFEAAGSLALLLLAAILSAAQPARGPAFDPPTEAVGIPTATTQAGDLVVTLSVKPNLPGRNFVSLGVFDTRRPAPAPIEAVLVGIQRPGVAADAPLAAESLAVGRYLVVEDLLAGAGDWRFMILVKRPGLPDTATTLPWTVQAPAPPPRPVLVSNRSLAPALTLAALLSAMLLISTLIAARLRYSPAVSEWALVRRLVRSRTRAGRLREQKLPSEEGVVQ